ncbi:MAG: helix-turn-helix transcriptional regulator [Candidatus Pristimantibacillus sp.]
MNTAILDHPTIDVYYHTFQMKYTLTAKEVDVLKLLTVHGQSNRELGESLSVTEKTMKNHMGSIFLKTGTHSSRELQALVFRETFFPLLNSADISYKRLLESKK